MNGKRRVEKEVDLNEDSDADAQSGDSRSASENEDVEDEEEEMDEDNSGEFFDVLDVFDGRADIENDDDPPPKKLQNVQTKDATVDDDEEWGGAQDVDVGMNDDESENQDADSDQDDEEQEDSAVDEDEDLHISASDSEDPSPEALADLETFLSHLDPAAPHKRKPDEGAEPSLKKRRRVADRTEAGEESEFGVRGTYIRRYHTSRILTSLQARVLSSWTTFSPRWRLPLPSPPSGDQRNRSRRPA